MELADWIFAAIFALIGIAVVIYGIKEEGIAYTATAVGILAACSIGLFAISKFDAHLTEKMGDEWHTSLLMIAIIAIAVAAYSIRRCMMAKWFQKMTSDCLEYSHDSALYAPMVNRINREAYGDGYSVCDDSFRKILDRYELYIMDRFINRCTTATKKDIMPSEQFFYYSLLVFLSSHSSDCRFFGNDMREYDCKITDWIDRYKLTPFGEDYYKIYLAAATYCASKKLWSLTDKDGIKKNIDTGTVDIATYMP